MFDELNIVDFPTWIMELKNHPWQIITAILDILIVIFLLYELIKFAKETRVRTIIKRNRNFNSNYCSK